MTDPYKILNISPNALDEEVKKAYRELAKKYHPDKYADSPLAEKASEKMKEINAAYETIMKDRKEGNNYSSSYGSRSQRQPSYNNYQGSQYSAGESPTAFSYIRSLIMNRKYKEAENLLTKISSTDRNGEWYYLMGIVCFNKGHLEEANNYLETACRIDPYNLEYNEFYHKVKNSRKGKYRGGYDFDEENVCCNCSDCDCCDLAVYGVCVECLCGVCRHFS